MIRKSSQKLSAKALLAEPQSDVHATHEHRWFAILLEGLGVGVLTGFVGVGGGFAIIPALVLLGGIPMKEAVGTSLLIIAFKSAAGFLGYLGQVEIDWNLMLSFTFAAGFWHICRRLLDSTDRGKATATGIWVFCASGGDFCPN